MMLPLIDWQTVSFRHCTASVDREPMNDKTQMFDESLFCPVPDTCDHAWVDICVEGIDDEGMEAVKVHQLCGRCRHYRIESRALA